MLVLLLVQKSARQAAPAPAGEEEEAGPDLVSDRSQALAGLARPGARSNRRPCAPQRYTFLQCCAREILCYGAALFVAVVHFPTCSVDVPCAESNSFLLYQALEKFSMQRQS